MLWLGPQLVRREWGLWNQDSVHSLSVMLSPATGNEGAVRNCKRAWLWLTCGDYGARRSMIIGIPNRGRSVMSAQGSTVCPGTR